MKAGSNNVLEIVLESVNGTIETSSLILLVLISGKYTRYSVRGGKNCYILEFFCSKLVSHRISITGGADISKRPYADVQIYRIVLTDFVKFILDRSGLELSLVKSKPK